MSASFSSFGSGLTGPEILNPIDVVSGHIFFGVHMDMQQLIVVNRSCFSPEVAARNIIQEM